MEGGSTSALILKTYSNLLYTALPTTNEQDRIFGFEKYRHLKLKVKEFFLLDGFLGGVKSRESRAAKMF